MNAKFNKDLIESLLAKEKGYTLTEEEQQEVDKVVAAIDAILDQYPPMPDDNDFDTLYLSIRLADKGFWTPCIVPDSDPEKEKKVAEENEKIDCIGNTIAYYKFDECGPDFFGRFPLAVPYLEESIPDFPLSTLQYIATCYLEGNGVEKDEDKFFKFAMAGADYEENYNATWSSEFDHAQTLIDLSEGYLLLAMAYRTGTGTERDLVQAFKYLYNYRREYIVQRWGVNNCTGEFEELFEALKKDADEGKTYPGLYYALAIMYREGMGTTYNYDAYKDCLDKEQAPEYLEELFAYNDIKINTYRNGEPIKVVKKITDNLEVGDIVEYGKYDYRSLLWEVLDIKDDNALLLCTECVESTYIANFKEADIPFESFSCPFSKYLNDVFLWADPFDEDLPIETERGYAFLLTKDEVERYLPNEEDRFCGARLQAHFNGYDGYFDHHGIDYDDDSTSAPWWTGTEGNNGKIVYVSSDGKIHGDEPRDNTISTFSLSDIDLDSLYDDIPGTEESSYDNPATIGIRPAVLVKVRK